MTTEEPKLTVKLNVSVDRELHRDLLKLGADRGQKLTVLVPSLLRDAVARAKSEQKEDH